MRGHTAVVRMALVQHMLYSPHAVLIWRPQAPDLAVSPTPLVWRMQLSCVLCRCLVCASRSSDEGMKDADPQDNSLQERAWRRSIPSRLRGVTMEKPLSERSADQLNLDCQE